MQCELAYATILNFSRCFNNSQWIKSRFLSPKWTVNVLLEYSFHTVVALL